MQSQRRNVLSASTLTGDSVRNPGGDDVGKIVEFMLDVRTGQVAYAVLSSGGFLGVGDRLFAIPYPALSLDQENHAFVLDVDKEVLENAPGFDQDHWPDFGDPNLETQLATYYGL